MYVRFKKKKVNMFGKLKYRKTKMIIKILAIILILFCVIEMADNYIRTTVITYATHIAENRATVLITDAINKYLSDNNINYNSLMTISRNDQGSVTSIETDMVKINKIRSEIVTLVNNDLKNKDKTTVSIPIGSLTNSTFLSGRGFKVDFLIMPTSVIKTEFKNNFISAGINQTRHQVVFDVSLDINCSIPIYENPSKVVCDVVICETIIVGAVPNYILTPQSNIPPVS